VIRVPWIRCRADEAGAQLSEMEWQQQIFSVLAIQNPKPGNGEAD